MGEDDSNQIQTINFDNVFNLNQAKSKQWNINLASRSLTYNVFKPGVQFYDNKLFVISAIASSDDDGYIDSSNNKVIQRFDLSTSETKFGGV